MARAAQAAPVPSSDPQGRVQSIVDSALLSRRIGPTRIHGGHFGGVSRRHEAAVGSRRQSPTLSLGMSSGAVSSRSSSLQPGWGLPALVLPADVHRASAAGSDGDRREERLPSRGLTASSGR